MSIQTPIANARMYAVAPSAISAWRALFAHVAQASGIELTVIDHPFPAPLSALWSRTDLACAFICGWPYTRGVADVVPVAAPVPADPRAAGRPVYWSDLVVRTHDPAQTLEDLRGRTVGYTVADSQSGFNALRHFLRGHTPSPLFGAESGPLITPRRVIEAVISGAIDAGPVDSIAHALLRLHAPDLADQVRTIAQTQPTAAPLLVASPGLDEHRLTLLRRTFIGLCHDPAAQPLLAALALAGFAEPLPPTFYQQMQTQALAAEAAGIRHLEAKAS